MNFPGPFDDNDNNLLDNFDFDSFLNNTEENGTGLTFGGESMQWNDSSEVGADGS